MSHEPLTVMEITTDEYKAIAAEDTGKRHKYRAIPTEVDGHTFPSMAEANRYVDLKHLLEAGEIEHLELQPKYPIEVNGTKVCTYIADFRYWDAVKGVEVVEDVKGVATPIYRLKAKLVKATYGVEIIEVKPKRRGKAT